MQAAVSSRDPDSEGGSVPDPMCTWRVDHHGRKETQRSCPSTGTALARMYQHMRPLI